ncbi:hypothetical protein GJ496_001382 [Pomphorhynchus laevis]|nr:hypothetical protein GJ496_001382 [Pomphorhynchus laevis]
MVDTNDADEIAIQSDRQSNQIQDELDYEDDLPPETTSNFPQSDLIAADSSNADAEMEEGEVEDEQALTSSSVTPRKLCYFYKIGKCTWGRQCKFLHPSINDTGNTS